jgi:ABC-2 type transport system ATP-binding protein
MTVQEYLSFAGQIRGLTGKTLRNAIEKVVELCGIADKLGRLTGNLSKGYRQRVGLAQALVHDPEILILDEPTVGLDPKQIIEIRELIRTLGVDRTVILSSHILQEVTSICQKVAIINEGTLVECDTIENLSRNLDTGQKIIVSVAYPENIDMDRLRKLDHVKEIATISDNSFEIDIEAGYDIRANISETIAGMGAGLLEMRTKALSLEEIFLKVVTGV